MSAVCTSPVQSSLSLSSGIPTLPAVVRNDALRFEGGSAKTLHASVDSVLSVRRGKVWITVDATANRGSEDLVLAPGDLLTVRAGQRLVIEPWDSGGAACGWNAA